MVQKRLTLCERLQYARIEECPQCECQRIQAYADRYPVFSFSARCPKCGTPDLRVRRTLDHIDPLYRNPISLIQKYLGAAVLYCVDCRLQFYDLRPRRGRRRL